MDVRPWPEEPKFNVSDQFRLDNSMLPLCVCITLVKRFHNNYDSFDFHSLDDDVTFVDMCILWN